MTRNKKYELKVDKNGPTLEGFFKECFSVEILEANLDSFPGLVANYRGREDLDLAAPGCGHRWGYTVAGPTNSLLATKQFPPGETPPVPALSPGDTEGPLVPGTSHTQRPVRQLLNLSLVERTSGVGTFGLGGDHFVAVLEDSDLGVVDDHPGTRGSRLLLLTTPVTKVIDVNIDLYRNEVRLVRPQLLVSGNLDTVRGSEETVEILQSGPHCSSLSLTFLWLRCRQSGSQQSTSGIEQTGSSGCCVIHHTRISTDWRHAEIKQGW